jgi:ABC-type lipoprotein export system ATPase subunit
LQSPGIPDVIGMLEEFETGSYTLDGEDVKSLTDNERSHIRNRKIGFVFQGFNLIPNLNIYDNVDAPLHYRRMRAAERRKRVSNALDRVGLTSPITAAMELNISTSMRCCRMTSARVAPKALRSPARGALVMNFANSKPRAFKMHTAKNIKARSI